MHPWSHRKSRDRMFRWAGAHQRDGPVGRYFEIQLCTAQRATGLPRRRVGRVGSCRAFFWCCYSISPLAARKLITRPWQKRLPLQRLPLRRLRFLPMLRRLPRRTWSPSRPLRRLRRPLPRPWHPRTWMSCLRPSPCTPMRSWRRYLRPRPIPRRSWTGATGCFRTPTCKVSRSRMRPSRRASVHRCRRSSCFRRSWT